MKTKILLSFLLNAFLGGILAISIGVHPAIGATALNVVALAIPQDSTVLNAATGFSLTDINTALGAYCRKFERQIMTGIFQKVQLENYCRKISGVSDEYAIGSATQTEVLQPFQHAWTPKGTSSFDAIINKVRQVKIDYEISEIDQLYQSYICEMADESKHRSKWEFVRWLVSNQIMPKVAEEMDHNSYNGVYAAPTPGTAGASSTSVNGFKKVIEDLITAGDLTPVATGAIDATNILDKVEGFVDDLPAKYQAMKAPILMSSTNARKYWRDYRNNFGGNNNYQDNNNLKVDATNKMVIGIDAMNGSDRFIHTPKANMLVMFDKISYPANLETQVDKRVINLLGDFKRGYGFGELSTLFINDQA